MRTIRKNQERSGQEAAELLGTLLALEILSPSRCLWVVSPWITDLPIVDNRLGSYQQLTRYGRRWVSFSEILVEVAIAGGNVVVATSPDPQNRQMLAKLRQLSRSNSVEDRVSLHVTAQQERMHGKSMAGDDFVLEGSMNFTYSGVLLNQEVVVLHTDTEVVAGAQRELFERFGGVLQ